MFHAGLSYRISNSNSIALSAGIAPSWGETVKSISVEHRLYFGKNSSKSNQKIYFFRQGTTLFPQAGSHQQFTINLSVGKDGVFKNHNNGLTMDIVVFYLPQEDRITRSRRIWPSFRIQFYF
jgi:hypothetical protein